MLCRAAAAISERLESAEQHSLQPAILRCTVLITYTGLPGREGTEAEHTADVPWAPDECLC